MNELLNLIEGVGQNEMLRSIIKAVVVCAVGLVATALVARQVQRGSKKNPQRSFVLKQTVRYSGFAVTFVWALHVLGFDPSVLLGAAGILTVAIGFASQTAASNLISGLFLIGEQPFGVGDIIRMSDVSGEVLSIDLLSVKLRTFDNLLVRVPNETVLKTNVVNLTRYPVRRIELAIGVAYKDNLAHVRRVLMDTADSCVHVLKEPRPRVIFLSFGSSAVELQFNAWCLRESFLDSKNALLEDIKMAFEQQGIEIPFPQVSLHTGP